MGIADLAIRDAVADDCAAMARLIEELGYPGITPQAVAERLADLARLEGRALVGVIEGQVIACLTLSKMRVLHRPLPVGRISMFVVGAQWRGQGIGSAMLDRAEARLREEGCGVIEVTSNMRRTRAHAFYEERGWTRSSYRFSREG